MKKIIDEFKAFISKGNVLDLAVGMIIGAAFTAIVKSLVDDVIMPVLSLITGKVDFANLYIGLAGQTDATLEAAKEAGAVVAYGNFIMAIVNFLLVALVIFFIVKGANKLKKKEEEAPKPAPEPSAEEKLLTEIRDLLKNQEK